MAATGEVILIGTPGSTSVATGSVANLFQNPPNFTSTRFVLNTGGTAYIDLGSGNTAALTAVRMATIPNTIAVGFQEYYAGVTVFGKATSGGTQVNIKQLGFSDTVLGMVLTEFPLRYASTAYTTPSYEVFGYTNPNTFGELQSLQFIADATSIVGTPTFLPMEPIISPWGGRFPAGSTTVTITSRTISASIYYTTDGSTPTNTNGTLYSGPFTLTLSGAVTLQAVAYDTNCTTALSSVSTSYFKNYSFAPRDDVYDDHGNLLQAHAPGFYWDGTLWYRYGQWSDYQNTASNGDDQRLYDGVRLYTSPDLQNWSFKGRILDNFGAFAIQCPWVAKAQNGNGYVLWAQWVATGYANNYAALASAPTPAGPWRWVKKISPDQGYDANNRGFKNSSGLTDSDGSVWVTYVRQSPSSSANYGIVISKLSPDGMSTLGASTYAIIDTAPNIEGGSLSKIGGYYFIIYGTSTPYECDTTDVAPSYRYATSLTGPWSSLTKLFASSQLGTNYNAQPFATLNVNGQLVFHGDYWENYNLYAARDVTLPITRNGTTLSLTTPATWNLLPPYNGALVLTASGPRRPR